MSYIKSFYEIQDEFKNYITITNNKNEYKKLLEEEKILEIKNSNYLRPLEFYKNLIFNPKSIDEVKNIKISFDIVISKEMKDIFKFFRENVCSYKNYRLLGKQIYILVKDLNSCKYLGIISLSSDLKNRLLRDEYIGWNDTNKNLNLNYVFEISNCIPLQPFGYNFCGGKLLTLLLFSREIQDIIYSKYNHYCLCYTAIGFYGKSVQYSNLKNELKYIGSVKGIGISHINKELYIYACEKYIKKNDINYYNKLKLLKKNNYYKQILQYFNINCEFFTQYNHDKGLYIGYTPNNTNDTLINECILNGKLPLDAFKNDKTKSVNEQVDYWLTTFALKRYNNLNKKNLFKNSMPFLYINNILDNNKQLNYLGALIDLNIVKINTKKYFLPEILIKVNSKDLLYFLYNHFGNVGKYTDAGIIYNYFTIDYTDERIINNIIKKMYNYVIVYKDYFNLILNIYNEPLFDKKESLYNNYNYTNKQNFNIDLLLNKAYLTGLIDNSINIIFTIYKYNNITKIKNFKIYFKIDNVNLQTFFFNNFNCILEHNKIYFNINNIVMFLEKNIDFNLLLNNRTIINNLIRFLKLKNYENHEKEIIEFKDCLKNKIEKT